MCVLLETLGNRCFDISDISTMMSNQLTDGNSKDSWFPMRNSLLIDVAAIHAHSKGSNMVAIGLIAGPTFPDTSESFLRIASRSVSASLGYPVQVYSPFLNTAKSEVVALGKKLGVHLEDTYSCYQGEARHCGKCQGCHSRKRAFLDASVPDPTAYQAGK